MLSPFLSLLLATGPGTSALADVPLPPPVSRPLAPAEALAWLVAQPELAASDETLARALAEAAPLLGSASLRAERLGDRLALTDGNASVSISLSGGGRSKVPLEMARAVRTAVAAGAPAGVDAALRGVFDAAVRRGSIAASSSEGRPPLTEPAKAASDRDSFPWRALIERASRAAGRPMDVSRVEAVKLEAARRLRNEPGLGLERVLAKAVGSAYGLAPEQADAVEGALAGTLTRELVAAGQARGLFSACGVTYAASENGLFALRAGRWKLELKDRGVRRVVEAGGRVFALAGPDAYERRDGRWSFVFAGPGGYEPQGVAEAGGELYVATKFGVFRLRDGRDFTPGWKGHVVPRGAGMIHHLESIGGELWVAAGKRGFYVRRGGRWRREGPRADAFHVTQAAGQVVASSDKGLFARAPDGTWTREIERIIRRVETVGGSIYAVGDSKLFVGSGDGWKVALDGWSARGLVARDGVAYASTADGLYRLGPNGGRIAEARVLSGLGLLASLAEVGGSLVMPARDGGLLRWSPPLSLGKDWRERALRELGAAPSEQASQAPALQASDGAILRAGRAIFGGLRSLLARLGATFGAERRDSSDVWTELARWMKSELVLEIPATALPVWKSRAAGLLRNEPHLPLEEALARAAAQAAPLNAASVERAERLLRWGATREVLSPKAGSVKSMVEHDGNTYAAGFNALWVGDGGSWRKDRSAILRGRVIESVAELDGKLYLPIYDRVLVWEKGRWRTDFERPDGQLLFSRLYAAGGKLFLGADRGGEHLLFVKSGSGWAREPSFPGTTLHGADEVDGKLYLSTGGGVFVQEAGGWRRLGDDSWTHFVAKLDGRLVAGRTQGLFVWDGARWSRDGSLGRHLSFSGVGELSELDGRTYAATGSGVFEKGGAGWRLAIPFEATYSTEGVRKLGGRILVVGRAGKAVFEWSPPPRLEAALRAEALDDLGVAAEVAAAGARSANGSGELASDGPAIRKNGRSIFEAFKSLLDRFGASFGEEAAPRADDDPWRAMDEDLRAGVGIDGEAPIDDWKLEAARLVKNAPETPLMELLARSYAKVRGLTPGQATSARSILLGTAASTDAPRRARRLFTAGGAVYAAPDSGLLKFEGGRWVPVEGFPAQRVNDLLEWRGALYAGTDTGLLKRSEGWNLLFSGKVASLAEFQGRLVTGGRSVVVIDGNLDDISRSADPETNHVGVWNGRLYVSNGKGLFEVEEKTFETWAATWWDRLRGRPGKRTLDRSYEWKTALHETYQYQERDSYSGTTTRTASVVVNASLAHGGALYAATDKGLRVFKDGGWSKATGAEATRLFVMRGRVHARTAEGLVAETPSGWEKVAGPDVLDAADIGGRVRVATKSGLRWFAWASEAGAKRILVELAATDTTAPQAPQDKLDADDSGIQKGGRSIFSQLRTFGSSFPQAAPRSEPPRAGVWTLVERELLGSLKLERAARAEEFRRSAADVLHRRPELILEDALAEAFAKAHALTESQRDAARDALMTMDRLSKTTLETYGQKPKLQRFSVVAGELIARTLAGHHRFWNGGWHRMYDHRPMIVASYGVSFTELTDMGSLVHQDETFGRLDYLAADDGVHAGKIGKGGFEHVLSGVGPVRRLGGTEARLFAAGERGLRVRERGRWRRLHEGRFHDVLVSGSRIFAAGNDGLHVFERGSWRVEPLRVRRLAASGERVFAITQEGILERTGAGWTLRLERKAVTDLREHGGFLYIGDGEGVYRWRPDLPEGWRQALLADVASMKDEPAAPRASPFGGVREIFGRLGLDFADSAPHPSPPPQGGREESWDRFAEWARRVSGSAAAAGLDSWKAETARVLTNEPNLGLELAMARAFARLSATPSDELEFRLSSRPEDVGPGNSVALSNGALYVAGGLKLRIRRGGAWEEAPLKDVLTVASVGGKIHVGTKDGLYVQDALGWGRLLEGSGAVSVIGSVNGDVFVRTDKGQFVRINGSWRAIPGEIGILFGTAFVGGRSYALASQGVFRFEANRWQPVGRLKSFAPRALVEYSGRLFLAAKPMPYWLDRGEWDGVLALSDSEAAAVIENRLFASDLKGLQELTLDGWKVVLPAEALGRRSITRIIVDGETAYFVTGFDSRIFRWAPRPKLLTDDERMAVLGELAEVAARSPADPSKDRLGSSGGHIERGGHEIFSPLRFLGLGFPAEGPAAVWTKLSRWLGKAGGLEAKVPPEAWRARTAELLRSRPETSLEEALAQAYAELRRLDPRQAGRLEALLGFGALPKLITSGVRMAAVDGRLLAAAHDGLYLQKGKAWTKLSSEILVKVLGELGGETYVAEGPRLLVWRGGRLREAFKARGGLVAGAAWANGRLWAAVEHDGDHLAEMGNGRVRGPRVELHRREGEHWTVVGEAVGPVYFFGESEGRPFLSNPHGNFVFDRSGFWSETAETAGPAEWAGRRGGRELVAGRNGLFERAEDRFDWKPLGVGAKAFWVGRVGGELLAATAAGVYRLDGKPKRVRRGPALQVLEVGALRYVLTFNGLEAWAPEGLEPPARWRETLLKDIADNGAAARRPALEARKGGLLRGGREIFSGLGRRLGLAFGEDEASADPWVALDEAFSDVLGLEASSSVEAWRHRTAALARAKPALGLNELLADAYVAARGLDAALASKLRLLAAGATVPLGLEELDESFMNVFSLDGELYASSGRSLYLRKGRRWTRVSAMEGSVDELVRLRGRLLAATRRGLVEVGGPDRGLRVPVHSVADWNGLLWAGTRKGLYALEDGRWRRVRLPYGDVEAYHLLADGERLLVSTALGLLEGRAARAPVPLLSRLFGRRARTQAAWRPLLEGSYSTQIDLAGTRMSHPLPVHSTLIQDGTLYAATYDGLRASEDGGPWRVVVPGTILEARPLARGLWVRGENGHYLLDASGVRNLGPSLSTYDAAQAGPLVVFAASRGVRAWLAPDANLRERLLEGLQSEVEALPSAPPVAGDDAGISRGGRSIFSGFAGELGLDFPEEEAPRPSPPAGRPAGRETAPWAELDSAARAALGRAPSEPPTDLEAWKERVRKLLVERPGLSTVELLAAAYPGANEPGDASKIREALALLWIPGPARGPKAFSIFRDGGSLYALSESLLERAPEGWRPVAGLEPRSVSGIATAGSGRWAFGEEGLFEETRGGWHKRLAGPVRSVVEWNGDAYAAQRDGIVRISADGAPVPLPIDVPGWSSGRNKNPQVHRLKVENGLLYASTSLGLLEATESIRRWTERTFWERLTRKPARPFEAREHPWRLVFQGNYTYQVAAGYGSSYTESAPLHVYDSALSGGEAFVATDNGVFSVRLDAGASARRLSTRPVHKLFVSDGRLHAAGKDTLWIEGYGDVNAPGLFDADADGESVLAAGPGGLREILWPSAAAERGLLEDVADGLPAPRGSGPSALQADGRGVSDGRGREIFSGLGKKVGLEFPDETPPPTSPPLDPWAALEAELLSIVEREAPSRAEDWKDRAAQLARSRPDLAIEALLAESFASVHGLQPEARERARDFLSGGAMFLAGEAQRLFEVDGRLHISRPGDARVHGRFGGRLFSALREGVHANEDGHINGPVGGEGYALAEWDGAVWGGTKKGLMKYEDGAWSLAWSPPTGWFGQNGRADVYGLTVHDGELYVSTHQGLFKASARRTNSVQRTFWDRLLGRAGRTASRRDLDWTTLLKERHAYEESSGYGGVKKIDVPLNVHGTAFFQGRLYAATSNGLRSFDGAWSVAQAGAAHRLAAIDGRLYAFMESGLHIFDGSAWSKSDRKASDVLRLGSRLYFATPQGVYVAPGETLELSRLLSSEIAARAEPGRPAEAERGISGEKGQILKEGRAIFTGLTSGLGRPFGAPLDAGPINLSRVAATSRRRWAELQERLRRGWESYRARRARASEPAVRNARSFLAEAFGMGQILFTDTTLGPKISRDALFRESRTLLRRHLNSPEAEAAFERFLQRALRADGTVYPNRLRKRVQDALIEASLVREGSAPGVFDSKLPESELAALAAFRSTIGSTLEEIRREARLLVARKRLEHPGPREYNVVGVLLTGSYAYGTATPASDLDLFVLTRDGTPRDVAPYLAELGELRAQLGWPDWSDSARYANQLPVDGEYTKRLVREFKSAVASPDPGVEASLGVEPDDPFYQVSRWRLVLHRLALPVYRLLLKLLLP